jgi:hypothetical protein
MVYFCLDNILYIFVQIRLCNKISRTGIMQGRGSGGGRLLERSDLMSALEITNEWASKLNFTELATSALRVSQAIRNGQKEEMVKEVLQTINQTGKFAESCAALLRLYSGKDKWSAALIESLLRADGAEEEAEEFRRRVHEFLEKVTVTNGKEVLAVAMSAADMEGKEHEVIATKSSIKHIVYALLVIPQFMESFR